MLLRMIWRLGKVAEAGKETIAGRTPSSWGVRMSSRAQMEESSEGDGRACGTSEEAGAHEGGCGGGFLTASGFSVKWEARSATVSEEGGRGIGSLRR